MESPTPRTPPAPVNPVRISRIGTNSIQVVIRPPADETETEALVARMERLVATGYDSIDIIEDDPTWRSALPALAAQAPLRPEGGPS